MLGAEGFSYYWVRTNKGDAIVRVDWCWNDADEHQQVYKILRRNNLRLVGPKIRSISNADAPIHWFPK